MTAKTPYTFNVELFRQLVAQTNANYEELSAGIGISQAALAQYISRRSTPTLPTLLKISGYFQVPIDVLMSLHTMEDYSEILKGNAEFMRKCRVNAYEDYLMKRKDAGTVAMDSFQDKDIYYSPYPYNLEEQVFGEPVDYILDEDLLKGLDKAMETLSPRERESIYLYFAEEKTLQEVGKVFGVTQERIRQIIRKGLRKLRHPLRTNLLRYGINGVELNRLKKLEMEIDAKKKDVEEKLVELKELEENVHVKEAEIKQRPVELTNVDELFVNLDLSVRSYNCLKRAGCETINDVLALMSNGKIFRVRNLGRKSIAEIQDKIGSEYHIKFKPVLNDNGVVDHYDYEHSLAEVS